MAGGATQKVEASGPSSRGKGRHLYADRTPEKLHTMQNEGEGPGTL